MNCQWQAFVRLLPQWMRQPVDEMGKDKLQELRMRIGQPPQLQMQDSALFLNRKVTPQDICTCINHASSYSPWAAQTIAHGFITAPGGHRLGICGDVTVNHGEVIGIANPSGICLRVARDYDGISESVDTITGSILIIGQPGSGKTTLLRDLIRKRSDSGPGSITVIDEKCEIFPKNNNEFCFLTGLRTDVLSGCTKKHGIIAALRNMGPETIAVDEITAEEDCMAVLHAGWCGVRLLATAHAGNLRDLYSRPLYRPIIDSELFQTVLILKPDKSWSVERICK